MLTLSKSSLDGTLGTSRVSVRLRSPASGLQSGGKFRLVARKDPVYGEVIFAFPEGGAGGLGVSAKTSIAAKGDPLSRNQQIAFKLPSLSVKLGNPIAAKFEGVSRGGQLAAKGDPLSQNQQAAKFDGTAHSGQPAFVISSRAIPGLNTLEAVSGFSTLLRSIPAEGTVVQVR